MVAVMLCNEATIVKREPTRYTFAPLRCKRWSCDYCLPMRKRWLRRDVRKGFPSRFLTLTIRRGSHETASEAARALAHQWRNMWRAVRRMFPGQDVAFFAVFERTKAGWPHLHICLRTPFIHQSWFAARMRAALDSPVVDIRKIGSVRKAAAYVAKYVGKNPQQFEGTKRFWKSLNWMERKEKPEPKHYMYVSPFEKIEVRADIFAARLIREGATLETSGDFWLATWEGQPNAPPQGDDAAHGRTFA